jgi:acetyltransferase-like isoleucine patch superfamily enzyme
VRDLIRLGYGEVPWPWMVVNFIFQRLLKINGHIPYPVNFTSRIHGGYPKIEARVGISLAMNGGMYLSCHGGIELGDNTFIGKNVGILTINHDLLDRDLPTNEGPTIIGRNCWLGMNSVILPGTRLGDNTSVAAGAVVQGRFPPNVVLAGAPARIVKVVNQSSVAEFRKRRNVRTGT